MAAEPVTRKPTGRVNHPFILLEGEEKAGKSFTAAKFAESQRIGRMFWLDLGEGTGDEYADPENPGWDLLVHDGTYAQVLERVTEVRDFARESVAKGEPPVVLVVDSGSVIWEGLKDWVTQRALTTRSGKAAVREDPNAEVKISRNLWNDAGTRYRRLLTILMTFPGIVVMTARGKEISATDPNTGQPYRDARKTWSVESHKSLLFDVDHAIRFTRSAPPLVVGCRTKNPALSIRPGVDDPKPIPLDKDNLLDWFVFDALGYNAERAQVRDLQPFTGGELLPEERTEDDGPGPDFNAPSGERFRKEVARRLQDAAAHQHDPIAVLRAFWDEVGEEQLRALAVQTREGVMSGADYIANWVKHFEAARAQDGAQSEPEGAHPEQAEPAQDARAEEQPPAQDDAPQDAPAAAVARAQEAAAEPAQEPEAKVAADAQTRADLAKARAPEVRAMEQLCDELSGQAGVLNIPVKEHVRPIVAAKKGAKSVTELPLAVVHRFASAQRAAVIEVLRKQGRATEADTYEAQEPRALGTWDSLTGADRADAEWVAAGAQPAGAPA